jgi:hypothetical protein
MQVLEIKVVLDGSSRSKTKTCFMSSLVDLDCSGEFWEAPLAHSHGRHMAGDYRIGLNSAVPVFSLRSSASGYHHGRGFSRSKVKQLLCDWHFQKKIRLLTVEALGPGGTPRSKIWLSDVFKYTKNNWISTIYNFLHVSERVGLSLAFLSPCSRATSNLLYYHAVLFVKRI